MDATSSSHDSAAPPTPKPGHRWSFRLELVATIVTVTLGILLCWRAIVPATPPTESRGSIDVSQAEEVSLDRPNTLGIDAARVVMIEYSDFQCPFCAKFAREELPQLLQEYVSPGKVAVSFKHMPLDGHPFALVAAQAAQCAGLQGQFWRMHDLIFAAQPSLAAPNTLPTLAKAAAIDFSRWQSCLRGSDTLAGIDNDRTRARSLQITGTPSFLFGYRGSGGRVRLASGFSGARPLKTFRQELDRLLHNDQGH